MPITTLRRQAMAHRYSAARDVGDVVTCLIALASDARFFTIGEVREMLDRTKTGREPIRGALWADDVLSECCVDEAAARAVALCAEAVMNQRDILGDRALDLVRAFQNGHRLLDMLMPFIEALGVEGSEGA